MLIKYKSISITEKCYKVIKSRTFFGWLLALLVSLQHRPLLTLHSLLVLHVSPEIAWKRIIKLVICDFKKLEDIIAEIMVNQLEIKFQLSINIVPHFKEGQGTIKDYAHVVLVWKWKVTWNKINPNDNSFQESELV